MSWSILGVNKWVSTASDGTSPSGTKAWPAAATTAGDLGLMVLVYRGTASPSVHSDWTLLQSSVSAETASQEQCSIYTYYHVYAGTAPNMGWVTPTLHSAVITAYRHSSETDYTFGTPVVGVNSDAGTATHVLSGGVASAGSDALVVAFLGNGRGQGYADVNAVTPSTGSGPTAVTTAPSSSAWYYRGHEGAISTTAFAAAMADAVLGSGSTGNITGIAGAPTRGTIIAVSIKPGVSGGGTISVANPSERKVYEGGSGAASVGFSGTYTGGAEAVQIQIEKASDSSVAVPWTTIAASPSDGTWSGSISIPRGGWYNAKVRKATSIAVTSQTTSKWGVGILIGSLGQSHLNGFGSNLRGTGTPDDRANQVATTTPALLSSDGAGRVTFANALIALLDCPVTFIDQGVDGTLLAHWYTSGGGVTSNYTTWAARVTAIGGALSAFFLWQGDANAQAGMARATYLAELEAFEAQVQSDFGSPLFVQGILGRYNAGADSAWDAIRRAHMDFVNGDTVNRRGLCCFAATTDGDDQHFDTAGNIVLGTRLAQVFANALGPVGSGIGPKIGAATFNGSQVRVTLSHSGGTSFSPTTAIGGFRVLDNGTPATIIAADRLTGSTLRLTVSAALTGPVTVAYGYGANPSGTSTGPTDNAAVGMPLYPTADPVTATFSSVVDYPASATEASTPVDASTATAAKAQAVAESAAAADSSAALKNLSAARTEAATASETSTQASTKASAATEVATGTDISSGIAASARAIVEAGAASDSSSAASSGNYSAGITESATLTDAAGALATLAANLVESSTATDYSAAAAAGSYTAAANEPAVVADVATAARVTFAAVLETALPIDIAGATSSATLPVVVAARRRVVSNVSTATRPSNIARS